MTRTETASTSRRCTSESRRPAARRAVRRTVVLLRHAGCRHRGRRRRDVSLRHGGVRVGRPTARRAASARGLQRRRGRVLDVQPAVRRRRPRSASPGVGRPRCARTSAPCSVDAGGMYAGGGLRLRSRARVSSICEKDGLRSGVIAGLVRFHRRVLSRRPADSAGPRGDVRRRGGPSRAAARGARRRQYHAGVHGARRPLPPGHRRRRARSAATAATSS